MTPIDFLHIMSAVIGGLASIGIILPIAGMIIAIKQEIKNWLKSK